MQVLLLRFTTNDTFYDRVDKLFPFGALMTRLLNPKWSGCPSCFLECFLCIPKPWVSQSDCTFKFTQKLFGGDVQTEVTKATAGGVPPFSMVCWSHSHE